MLDLGPIKETHQRADDSTKGAAEWFADYAQSAHEHRGLLIAEVERLQSEVDRLQICGEQKSDGSTRRPKLALHVVQSDQP